MSNHTSSSSKIVSASNHRKVVCVADLDSMLHRGYNRKTRHANPRGIIKLPEFTGILSANHVTAGTVCRNWSFGPIEEAIWSKIGLRCRACNDNADATVIAEARAYAAEPGVARIILISNDGDYCPLVQELKHRGVNVEIWCRRQVSSKQLKRLAHNVRYIDHLFSTSKNVA